MCWTGCAPCDTMNLVPAGVPSSSVDREPFVDIRYPRVWLIWPIAFTTFMVSVIVPGIRREGVGAAEVAGILLMLLLVVGLPLVMIVRLTRAHVRSEGTALRVCTGLRTLKIPAHRIDCFALVNRPRRPRDASALVRLAIVVRRVADPDPAARPNGVRGWVWWLRAATQAAVGREAAPPPVGRPTRRVLATRVCARRVLRAPDRRRTQSTHPLASLGT